MARGRRRLSKPATTRAPDENISSRSNTPEPVAATVVPDMTDESKCPLCTEETNDLNAGKEKWIMCDECKTWYHWRCAGNEEDVDTIDKWFVHPLPFAASSHTVPMLGSARLA